MKMKKNWTEGVRPLDPPLYTSRLIDNYCIYTFIIIFDLVIYLIIYRDFYNLNFFSYFIVMKLEN